MTKYIMETVEKEGRGFKNDNFKIGTLFFANDTLILTESLTHATQNIRIMVEVARCGLELNNHKRSIMLFNMKEQMQREGIKND